MLAYAFWHWPTEAGDEGYGAAVAAFHEALSAAPPPGFAGSSFCSVPALPWTAAAGFEDWYLVEGSAALDPLNDAAVDAARRSFHDAAAAAAGGGTAGLYRLRLGAAAPATARHACWLAKPVGSGYRDFFERLGPIVERSGGALWGRQMVLGPTPEFCLHSSRPPEELPFPVVLRVERGLLWPTAGGRRR